MPLSARGRRIGVGGSSAAGNFLPTQVDNIIAWYDASYAGSLWQDSSKTVAAENDTDLVKVWQDRSGHGFDITNADDNLRPQLKIVGGVNGLLFATDYLVSSSGVFIGSGDKPHTIITVVESLSRNTSNYEGIAFLSGTAANNQNSAIGYNSDKHWFGGYGQTTKSTTAPTTSLMTLAKKYASGNVKGYKNNTEIQSVSFSYSLTSSNLGIGSHLASPGGATTSITNTKVYEVLFYDRNITTNELTLIHNYLASKWSIS